MNSLTRSLLIHVITLVLYKYVDTLDLPNQALNKPITASDTCGSYGDEMYNLNSEINLSSAQRKELFCEYNITHLPVYMVDAYLNTSWQSTSRFLIYERGSGTPSDHREAIISLDLKQFFQVQTIKLDMSESLRPNRIAILKSENGISYSNWLFLVTLSSDCKDMFGVESTDIPKSPAFTTCTKFANVDPAIINETIQFDVLKGGYSFQTARYLKILFYEMGFVLGVSGNSFQHYTVRELEVLADCSCYNHQIGCEKNSTSGQFECVCGENTFGSYCEQCQPLFNQKGFRADIPCEACNCFGHAKECRYDINVDTANQSLNALGAYEGGGVCVGCQDNTMGFNCEMCLDTYYRDAGSARTDPCVACGCNNMGSQNETCVKDSASAPVNMLPGNCYCKANVVGNKCDQCKPGFYDMTSDNSLGCKDCLCEVAGCINSSNVCNSTGQCPCKANAQGRMCDTCKDGFFQLSQDNVDGCTNCGCDIGGVFAGGCDKITGQCSCLSRVTGRQCDSIVDGSYYPELHYIFSEAETPTGSIGDNSANAGFTGYGYAVLNANESLDVTLNIPAKIPTSQQFSLVFRYKASVAVTCNVSLSGLVDVTSVAFPPCSTNWCYLQVGGQQLYNFTPLTPYTVSVLSTGALLVDRIVAIPTEFFGADILGVNGPTFQEDCHVLENGRNIAVDKQAGCRGQIYSVVTNALSGGLLCDCSPVGSNSTVCEKVGGQCPCRPGVGGRNCNQCLPDHFLLSLEGCRPCNCTGTNKLCNQFNGQCYCTSTTIGRTCDTCANFHYDWTVNGCTACACDVGSSSFQCNTTSGICDCHVGVTGDKCDQCADEYKDLSSTGCVSCGCDAIGSTSTVCNKTSAQCPCKDNVVGPLCVQCSAISFDLDTIHPKGCADCVCMGITQSCDSSQWILQRVSVPLLDEINPNRSSLINIVNKQRVDTGILVTGERQPVEPILTVSFNASEELFWNIDYVGMIGNVLGMYGSFVEFELSYTSTDVGGQFLALDVVLLHGNEQLIHKIPITLQFNASNPIRVQVIEGSFKTPTGDSVSREQFLIALTQVQAWLLPASLIDRTHQTTLSKLAFTVGTPDRLFGDRAIHVEQCQCGQGYTGSSCENCGSGFKRMNVSSQGFLGFCERCTCNGHSNECDPDTGVCLNCQQNTQGGSCELCLPGFYGDATSLAGCLACPCYFPRVSDPSCEMTNGTVKCLKCNQGYTNPLCNKCEPFYYGQPEVQGSGTCTACNCHGNSNECNPLTGLCVNCSSNTGGDNCEKCLDGFYGNATNQNCNDCSCDLSGSNSNICDPSSGQCQCFFGVGERTCNQCQQGYWGYSNSTFTGCKECLCNSEGSETIQCSETAVCPCKPNVSGDKCDTCNEGFWGLPNLACTACNCNAIGSEDITRPCDRQTGQCGCKPGVQGRQCDVCQLLYTGFGPDGCTKCGECQDSLGNDTVLLVEKFTGFWVTMSDISQIQAQDQRLQGITQDLTTAQTNLGFSDLTTLQNLLADLSTKQITYRTFVNDVQTQLEDDVISSSRQYNDTLQEQNRFAVLVTDSSAAKQKSQDALTTSSGYVNDLSGYKTKADSLLQSTGIASVSSNLTFTSQKGTVDSELASSQDVSTQVNTVKVQVDNQNDALVTEEGRDRSLEDEVAAIQTRNSQIQANITSLQQQKIPIDQSLTNIQTQLSTSAVMMNNTRSILASAKLRLQSSTQNFNLALTTLNECTLVLGDNPTRQPLPLNTTVDISGIISYPSAYQSLSSSANQTTQNIQSARANPAGTLAPNLQAQSQALQNDFNAVVSMGQGAVTAKANYQTAVASLTESLTQAQNASQVVSEQSASLSGVNLINLEGNANSSRAQSDSLLNEVNSKNYQPQVLESQILSANATLQNSVREWANLATSLDAVTAEAQALDTGGSFSSTLNQADTNSQLIQTSTQKTRGNDVSLTVQLNALSSESIVIQDQSQQAISITAIINSKVINFENSLRSTESLKNTNNIIYNQIDSLKPNITSRLNDLEAKIQRARQLAEKLKQPVFFNNDGSNINKPVVVPNSLPTSLELCNKITFEFKSTTGSSGLLFFMENNQTASQFSVELIRGSVFFHFTINLERVQMTNPAEILGSEWYRVEASRCANSGQVTVTRLSTGGTAIIHRAGVSLNARIMMLSSDLFFGGLPAGYLTNNVLSSGFVGCIYNVWYREKQIPIWQIRVNSGEAECCRKPTYYNPIPTIPGTELSGFGHLQVSPPAFNTSLPTEFSLQFRTFKSNGVLFIMENQLGNVYYGVFLFSSTVIFSIQTPTGNSRVQSAESYNDGKWYQVSTRVNGTQLEMVMKYGVDGIFYDKETIMSASSVGGLDLSALQSRPVTLGSVNPEPIPVSTPTRERFSGYFSGFQFLMPGSASLTTQLLTSNVVSESGVYREVPAKISSGLSLYTAQSYAQLSVSTARTVESISVFFSTFDPDGVLLYAISSTTSDVLIYVAMNHGNIVLYYNDMAGGDLKGPLQTSGLYLSDGVLHNVEVRVLSTFRVQLKVDDITVEDIVKVPSSSIFLGTGFIYLGGVPDTVSLGAILPVKNTLIGGINSLSINTGAVNLLDQRLYESQVGISIAGIANPRTVPLLPPYTIPDSSTVLTSCPNPAPSATYSDIGVRFGDSNPSFQTHSLSSQHIAALTNSFLLTIQFRSYVSDGTLFFVADQPIDPTMWFSVYLKGGFISVSMSSSTNNANTRRLQSQENVYNNGTWWEVDILRINDFLAIVVSNQKDYKNNNLQSSTPSTLNFNTPVFIGGLDSTITGQILPAIEIGKTPLIGCIRKVEITPPKDLLPPFLLDLKNPTTDGGTGRCFNNAVPGVRMSGQASYLQISPAGIYSFQVPFTFSVSIRTVVRSGNIFTIYQSDSQFVVLDLFQGQLRCMIGNAANKNSPLIVTAEEPTNLYTLCNNKAHLLRLEITGTQLTIQVDNANPQVYQFPTGFTLPSIQGFFTVAGLHPDQAGVVVFPVSVSSSSFTGCLEGLTINQQYTDPQSLPVQDGVNYGCFV